MKQLLLFLFSLYLFSGAGAQLAGPQGGRSFGNATLAGSDKSWINTQYAAVSDNQFASFGDLPDVIGSHTDYLLAEGFGFNIPAGNQITGIVVSVESSDLNASTADYSIRIVKNGVIGTSEHSNGDLYVSDNTQGAYRSYGSKVDLWGEAWTLNDIMAGDFGVAIAAQRAVTGRATAGRIDDIRITVYYSSFTTLPLNISAFSATAKKDMARLEWTTTDESGMDRFEVQRSPDGADFISFGTLICKNLATATSYAFNDYSPFGGTSYYRLKILEKSGNVIYSKIISVQFKTDNATTIYPSPWKKGEGLFIRNPNNEKLTIQFYTETGEIVAKVNTSSGQVAIPSLAAVNGILRYKVFDEKNAVKGSGNLLTY
jgi:hypothetical protein